MPATLTDLGRPFLTDLDERLRVKGSRDPLGYMSVWGGFGRKVVGNLTNQTVSVRGFITLLLGHWFAERLQDQNGSAEASTLDMFLRFEQLAAYCRLHHDSTSEFRGIRRVTAGLQRGTSVRIGSQHEILSNQRLYGLWGLYSVASRVSGMLRDEPLLTPVASEFVERTYRPVLEQYGSNVINRIGRILLTDETTVHLDGRDAAIADAIAAVHDAEFNDAEREFFRFRLIEGGEHDSTAGLQQRLAKLLLRTPQEAEFSMAELRAITDAAAREGDQPLHDALERIRRMECILGPTSYLFGFILTRDRKPLDDIAAEVDREWRQLQPTLSADEAESLRAPLSQVTGDEATADRLVRMGQAIAAGEYGALVPMILEQNREVMASRDGSAPWSEIEKGRLKVRLRDETGFLPAAEEVPHLLRHAYFIAPLKVIQAELLVNA